MRDRGAISLIAGIIAVLTGAAIAAVTIVAVRANRHASANPPVFVVIKDATATRDAHGRPHITVRFQVGLGGSGSPPFLPETKVRCRAVEQGDRARNFEASGGVFVAFSTTRDASLTITPPESANDLEGEVKVRCDAAFGERAYTTAAVPVTVPGPGAAAADASQYQGVYQVTMTLVEGILLNCESEIRHRKFTITAPGPSTITVELSGLGTESVGISRFDATLSKTAQFSGEVVLIPGESAWQGLLSGGFTRTAASTVVKGRFRSDDGHCTYDYEGFIVKPTDAGVLAITLEEIAGVDGCEPVLAAETAKPGRVRFKVTNNTFGFAQIYIYDAEHNLTAHNTKQLAERGGSVEFSAELVAGAYDVQCDGPGSEDKTVTLTVG